MRSWSAVLTGPWGLPSQVQDWPIGHSGGLKALLMSDLIDLLRRMFGRVGRPKVDTFQHDTDETLEVLDHRLTAVERKARENAVRLELLEIAADPRGRFRRES